MGIIFKLLSLIFLVAIVFLFARFAISWLLLLFPKWHPRGIAAVVIEIVYTVTDPPVKFFRKAIPALDLGTIRFDLGFMVLMMLCLFGFQIFAALS